MENESFKLPPARPRRSGRGLAALAAIAFLAGGAGAGWLVWSGKLASVLPSNPHMPAGKDAALMSQAAIDPAARASAAASTAQPPQTLAEVGTVEGRLALIEERFSRLDMQARAASGNAGRAEALLVAFAVRRTIDRGAPLGYLRDQLQLRFGGAQPQAVQTLIAAAQAPVTLDELSASLDAMAPALEGAPRDESGWARFSREMSGLFVIRRAANPTLPPQDRVARARLMLRAGRIEEAIAEVQRLPGRDDAQDWIAAARRYLGAQQALDVIESNAMLDPRLGQDVETPTADEPAAAPASSAATPNPEASEG